VSAHGHPHAAPARRADGAPQRHGRRDDHADAHDDGHSHGLIHHSIKRSRAGVRAVALALLVPGAANAQSQWQLSWLGPAREISRGWSASRDTEAMTMSIAPRPVLVAGGQFALATFASRAWALRFGFAGMFELETDGTTDRFHSGLAPGASTGMMLWRGAYAYHVAVAPRQWGREVCESCRMEGALGYRHESQHYTGSNSGGDGLDVSDQPYVGDDVIADAALGHWLGEWYFAERLTGMWYLPKRSSYDFAGAVDLHVRFTRLPYAHPFCSLYAEYRKGDELLGRVFPDAYRFRALLGAALPSALGDIWVYGSGDVGNRYGIRILTREATLGLGIRLTIGRETSEAE